MRAGEARPALPLLLMHPPHVAGQQRPAGKGFFTKLHGTTVASPLLMRHLMGLQPFRPAEQLLTVGTAVPRGTLFMHLLVTPQLGGRVKLG